MFLLLLVFSSSSGRAAPTVFDSPESLRAHVDAAWTNSFSATTLPPGCTFFHDLGVLATSTNFPAAFFAGCEAITQDGIAMHVVEVTESNDVTRVWSCPGTMIGSFPVPTDYDATAWAQAHFPVPGCVDEPTRQQRIQEAKLSGRQTLRLRLISQESIPAYLATLATRAANRPATIGTYDIGAISTRLLPGDQTMEVLVHAPEEVEKIGVYQTTELTGAPDWTFEGFAMRLDTPVAFQVGLQANRRYVLFANHYQDSDGDGVVDAMEKLLYGTDEKLADTDGDGLSDREESMIWLTNPRSDDSDGDGVDDFWEALGGYNPLAASTGFGPLDWAHIQGVPPMEFKAEAIFPSPYGQFAELGHLIAETTSPALGPIQYLDSAQQPPHQAEQTYASMQILTDQDKAQLLLRFIAHEDMDVVPDGYCNPFFGAVRYGRFQSMSVMTNQSSGVSLDASPSYDMWREAETQGGLVCFQGSPPVTGKAVVKAKAETAPYILVRIDPTNQLAIVNGPPVRLDAVIEKPFSYYSAYKGPIRWDIKPPVEGGPRFVANTNTLYGTTGGKLDVEVFPGSTSGLFTVEARIAGQHVATAQIVVLPILVKDAKNPADAGDDVDLVHWDQRSLIGPPNIAWIQAHQSAQDRSPRMPMLEVHSPLWPDSFSIEAKLAVRYQRGNGLRSLVDEVSFPTNGTYRVVTGGVWRIWEEYAGQPFFGGDAIVSVRLLKDGQEILAPQAVEFRIGGQNPTPVDAKTFIQTLPNASPTGTLWFAYALAKHETKNFNGAGTRYNQFWSLPVQGISSGYKSSQTKHVGRPLFGNDNGDGPGGYGMFQVTGTATDPDAHISRQQIWHWQENARAARAILAAKESEAVAWMIRQKNSENANGFALPDLTVRSVLFSEGSTRTMNNAVTMKLWNGGSTPPIGFVDRDGDAPGFIIDSRGSDYYCFWKNAAPGTNKWALTRYNINSRNFVDEVCQEVE